MSFTITITLDDETTHEILKSNASNAQTAARRAVETGIGVGDGKGGMTYFPAHRILKVTVGPTKVTPSKKSK